VPLDPIVSLSVALAEAPGACACLLGSGVSVDAGVPTGWGIFQDGLRRLYRLETETEESPGDEQLDKWLREQEYDTLGYSSLLDLIAPEPAIRRELLAALAGRTQQAVLGTGVLLGALRPALLLAQTASTIDLISEGRFLLGLGAGFPFPETERQFEAIGVPYAGRVSRLVETIAALANRPC